MQTVKATLSFEVFNRRSGKVTGRFLDKRGAIWFRSAGEDYRPCDPIETDKAKPAGYGGGLGFGVYGIDTQP